MAARVLEVTRTRGLLGLAVAVAALLTSSAATTGCGTTDECSAGALGCSCAGNDLCAEGLQCNANRVCVQSEVDTNGPDAGPAANGGSGGAQGNGGNGGNPGGSGPTGGAPPMGGAGPTAGAGGGGFEGCDGFELQMSGVLDLDLQAVQVSGLVTLNGAALPDETVSRGAIAFVSEDNQLGAAYDLGATGAGQYALTLPPGTYQVLFTGGLGLCLQNPMSLIPCGNGVLLPAVELQADGVLNLDIPAVYMSGEVTLDGAQLPPEALERGVLFFTNEEATGASSNSLGMTGAGTYYVALLPGVYDIGFSGNYELCRGTTPSSVPCNSGILSTGVTAATGVLNVDLSAVQVTGAVTLAGGALPTEASSRGAVSFTQGDYTIISRDLTETGAGTYAVTLLPGTYDIGFAGNPLLCSEPLPPQIPCNGGVLLPGTNLMADGVLNLDLQAVTLSGAVTLNGAEFPAQTNERGAIAFLSEDTGEEGGAGLGSAVSGSFGTSGPAVYAVTLLPGRYSVHYGPSLFGCDPNDFSPCNGGQLLGVQDFVATGVLDLDVPSIQVSGNVTVNGVAPADEALERGQVYFTNSDETVAASLPFAATGPMSYSVHLFPGTYSVSFAGNAALCGSPAVPQVPCIGGQLHEGVALMANGVLDLDLPSISITGSVTLDGAPLPNEAAGRGVIVFSQVSGLTASASAGDLDVSGAGSYGISLFPGRYVIQHAANPSLCGPALSPQVPCASQLILGCD